MGEDCPDKGAGQVSDMLWASKVLIAADVIYDASSTEAFASLVEKLLKRGAAEVLHLAVEKRVYFSAATLQAEVVAYPQFLEECAMRDLVVKQVDLTSVPVHFDYVRSRYYELVTVTLDASAAAVSGSLEGSLTEHSIPEDVFDLKSKRRRTDHDEIESVT